MTTRQTPDAVREAVALLPKLRALLKPATARPWRVFDGGQGLLAIMKGDRPKVRSSAFDKRWKEIVKWAGFDGTDVGKRYDAANATLIVEAVNALPILLNAIEHLAALDSRAGEDVRPDSWAASPEDIRERVQLLADMELHLKSSRIFITTREKMHPCGVELHDELLGRVTAAIDSIGKAKGHD